MELFAKNSPKKRVLNLVRRETKPPIITIYLPTSRVWHENEEAQIKLKNILKDVREYLRDGNLGVTEIDSLLSPIESLLEDENFWKDQKEGLALFRSEDFFEIVRLPINLDSYFYITDMPNIKPLAEYLFGGMKYYVLALSLSDIRLFKGINRDWRKMEAVVMPESIDETRRTHDIERHLQTHPGGAQAARGKPELGVHGHGERDSTRDEQKKVFLDEVDWALNHFITDIEDEKKPLVVLACTKSIFDSFKLHSEYPNLCDEYMRGNPEDRDAKELLEEAWKIVKKKVDRKREASVDLFKEHRGSENAVESLDRVIKAAFEGRVDVLFVNPEVKIWGNYLVNKQEIDQVSGRDYSNRDLINYAITKTLLSGGKIVPVKEKNLSVDVAAVLRF